MSWDELVAAALIGTDRKPVGAGVPEGSPAELEAALATRGVEDRLLGAAAAWTVARRAGAVAAPAAPGVEPAEEDPRPIAPGATLRERLDGHYPSLLGEWLALAAARGLRPPPELVPALLDHAAVEPALQASVGEAAGPLGRWLAERRPHWAFAGEDVDGVWADGASDERRALLERLRRTDPAAARALLEATFADETWEDRAAFVALLAHGLSDADEPLLERALDDRRKPVREAAAHLLAGLPRSRFAARMAQRAAPLLRVEGGRLRGRRLVAELPGDADAAARRDGVPAGGRRSERLHVLLAATPLRTWTARMPRAPRLAARGRRDASLSNSSRSRSRTTSGTSSAARGRTRRWRNATPSGRGRCGRSIPIRRCSPRSRSRRRRDARPGPNGRTSSPLRCPGRGARR